MTAHSNASSTSGKRPAWADEGLVACVDGPMVGQWYTAADWTERITAAAHMADRRQPPTAALAYVPTGRSIAHPHVPDATGVALTVRPHIGDDDALADEVAPDAAGRDDLEDGWVW